MGEVGKGGERVRVEGGGGGEVCGEGGWGGAGGRAGREGVLSLSPGEESWGGGGGEGKEEEWDLNNLNNSNN